MTAAIRTDWLSTEGAVFDCLCYIVGAVAVIKRAHNLKLCLTAAGARCFIDNMVAGVALVPALFNRNIFKSGVFFLEAELFRCPVHGNILIDRNDIITGVAISNIFDLASDILILISRDLCFLFHLPLFDWCAKGEKKTVRSIFWNDGILAEIILVKEGFCLR